MALAAAACGGGSSSSGSNNSSSGGGVGLNSSGDGVTGTQGGTLYVPMLADFEHLDPARNYVNTQLDASRLLYRTLTTYKAVSGDQGNTVVPDLATSTGTASDNAKTWKFTLKDGLKYEDGSPITTADIKYGISRAFDPDLPEGPQYIQQDLANVPKGYKGPTKSGSVLPNSSISTPDAKTIIFHLSKPVGDFSYLASEPTFAPVPKAKDTGVKYDNHVFSSGPYKIQTYNRGKNMILVRNTNWSRSTDTVRGAYPDKINFTFGLDSTVLDQKLETDSGTDQSAVMFDSTVQPQDLANVLTKSSVKDRSTTGLNGFTEYVAINTRKLPNLKVRQALTYATNKQTYRAGLGGSTAGDYASNVSIPSIPGHQDLSSLYKAPPTGDISKGNQLLQQAGYGKGGKALNLTVGVSDSSSGVRIGTAMQQSLQRLDNVKVSIDQIPLAKYYDVIGNPSTEPDLVRAGWGADWPSMSTVLPPLFDGRQIKPAGNQNFALLNNPSIDSQMDKIEAITDTNAAAKQWGALEKTIMEQAPLIPILYLKGVLLHGSKVKGAYLHSYYGLYDLVSLSVM